MLNQDLIQKIENLLYLQEKLINDKYEPYITCGEIWEQENKLTERKNEIIELLNNCTIYRR